MTAMPVIDFRPRFADAFRTLAKVWMELPL